MPRPIIGFSRYFAPSWMLIFPAISLIGVRHGNRPVAVLDRLIRDGDDLRFQASLRQLRRSREMKIREHDLPRPEKPDLRRLRLLDLDHHLHVRDRLGMSRHDFRAGLDVIRVCESARYARQRFDENLMPAFDEQFHADRHHRDAIFVRFNFLGDSDTHLKNRLPLSPGFSGNVLNVVRPDE